MHSEIIKVSRGIKKRVLEHTIKQNGGYMGQACSSADLLSCLYLDIMNLKKIERPLLPPKFQGVPSNENKNYKNGSEFNGGHEKNFDRFYLSPAQYALVLYALLIETKRMDESALEDFNKDGSSVEMIGAEHSPGMEVTTGSLGQGLSQSIGAAYARKLKNDEGINYVFMSDGEFQIGMTYEAIQTMCHYQLDNVRVYVDVNGHQCDGTTTEVMNVSDLVKKVESFGACAIAINGHDIDAIIKTKNIPHHKKPLFVFCQTLPYNDLPEFESNRPKFHYLRFTSADEKNKYIKALERMSQEWK
jgi:transketolase